VQATHRLTAMPVPINQTIRGAVSDATSRYAVHLNWNGSRVEGRLGGWWFPEKISLERSPHGLIGQVNSRSVHLTVNVTLNDAQLELLIAGHGDTQTIALELSGANAGMWRGHDGQRTPVHLEQSANEYTVMAGQQRVTLSASSSPAWVILSAALVSLAAQRAVSQALLESLRAMREQ
jgi:hypothetical protein